MIPIQLEQVSNDILLNLALWYHSISENRVVYYYVIPYEDETIIALVDFGIGHWLRITFRARSCP